MLGRGVKRQMRSEPIFGQQAFENRKDWRKSKGKSSKNYLNLLQLLAMDILALVTMKNAAKCDT